MKNFIILAYAVVMGTTIQARAGEFKTAPDLNHGTLGRAYVSPSRFVWYFPEDSMTYLDATKLCGNAGFRLATEEDWSTLIRDFTDAERGYIYPQQLDDALFWVSTAPSWSSWWSSKKKVFSGNFGRFGEISEQVRNRREGNRWVKVKNQVACIHNDSREFDYSVYDLSVED